MVHIMTFFLFFFFQAEDGIRDATVTGVKTCALPISGHLETAREAFEPLPFFKAPLFDREMVGTEMLDEFGRRVFADQDPTAVLYQGKPIEVKKEKGSYALYIRLPFAEKDRIQVWTRGDELVVQVDNQRRHLMLPRTLAGRAVASAAFLEHRLRVSFGEKEVR